MALGLFDRAEAGLKIKTEDSLLLCLVQATVESLANLRPTKIPGQQGGSA